MSTSISRNFSPWDLLKFAAPSIIMMVFMSLYTIVDGMFISRFVGSNALSSLNIVFPVINVAIAISTMLGTGGNAIISKYLGEFRDEDARKALTQFTVLCLGFSFLLMLLSLPNLTLISRFLGSSEILLADCRVYLGVSMLFAPAAMLQGLFQSYFVTAGKPGLGLWLMIGAGIFNVVFDYVLIVPCQMGIAGAALATGIGQCIPALFGLFFFLCSKGELHFCKFTFHMKEILSACYNGSSEMVSQLANAIITYLFNIIMMQLVGEHGVAAITILLYGQFLFNAFYLGFTIGISPIVGFQYGAGDKQKLRNIYHTSFLFVAVSSVFMAVIAIVLSPTIVTIFTDDPATYELAAAGFRLFAINFLFSGISITSSGFLTALSNGTISAVISFCRTLGFIVLSLLILPKFLGITGAWIAIPVAEFCTLLVTGVMHFVYFWKPGIRNYLR